MSVDLRIASRGARLEDDAGPSSGEQVRAHPFAAPAKPGAMTGRAYIATFGVLALAGFVLIAALGLAVDAYGVFGTRLIRASHFPPQLRLFDFARPHHLVEQSPYVPPPPGERRYYLETNHFYPWLGDKVLAKVFGREEDEATDDAFGRQIGHGSNSISIDEDIATAKAALDQWEGSHPDDVSLVKRIVSH